MNHYSVVKGYFRFKKLWINRYITRYRVVKLRCLLDNIIISLYKYVDLASKFLIKMHTRKEPLLAIGLLLHHWSDPTKYNGVFLRFSSKQKAAGLSSKYEHQ